MEPAAAERGPGKVPGSEQRLLEGPTQGKANADRGNDFHKAVYDALGEKENTSKVVGIVRGKAVNTEPDLIGLKTGVTDIKDKIRIGFDEQLQAQYDYAKTNNKTFNLIISPNTKTISVPLQNAVRARGGIIVEFNSKTGTFSSVTIQGNQVVR
jgi:hypothetical protein